jgi:alkanesulfonate monooxygenase SsuD/methylene tetrahydromethanopterin reductase-like flavin-dependent oxidoreductase (luciferase family)
MSPSSRVSTLRPDGPVHWGVMLAQGWKGELSEVPAHTSWQVAQEWAGHAEDLGFDGVWVFDHFQPYPRRDASPVLEAWTTLSALSQTTRDVVLGTLVSCAAYRHPGVTAKMAATLGVLSQGRFCLGLGAGWDQPEFAAFGVPFRSASERSDSLERTLRTCRASWTGADPDPCADDRDGAVFPRISPVPSPGPLLLVGGEGERRTLGSAAEHADLTNWQVGVEVFRAKSAVLERWCSRTGRDVTTIRRTHAPNVHQFDSEREFSRWKQDESRGMSAAETEGYIRSRGAFFGTVERVVETIDEFLDAGCEGFMMFCTQAPATGALDQLARLRPAGRRPL